MSADDASGPVKAAHKAAILEVQQRNEAAHKAAKEKRKAKDLEGRDPPPRGGAQVAL